MKPRKSTRRPAKDRELAETMALVTTSTLSEAELEMVSIYRLAKVPLRGAILTLLRWRRQHDLLAEKGAV